MKLWRGGGKQAQLEHQLALAQELAEQRRIALQQLQEECAAYRRRTERASNESVTAARGELLAQLLPVFDDLRRAFNAVPPELAESSWTLGIALVAKSLATTLHALEVQRFGKMGSLFDPRFHEVISTQVCPDLPEGTIIQVALPGYTLAGRMIRPAQVVVSLQPPADGR